eukprot:COSAG03_NODE_474_length_7642_cov_2.721331_1_plen_48_part_00
MVLVRTVDSASLQDEPIISWYWCINFHIATGLKWLKLDAQTKPASEA